MPPSPIRDSLTVLSSILVIEAEGGGIRETKSLGGLVEAVGAIEGEEGGDGDTLSPSSEDTVLSPPVDVD